MSSSIVSPNVGEELRVYAKEQEDLMRQRVADYRQQLEIEYRRTEAETRNRMYLIEYLASARDEDIGKVLQTIDTLIEKFKDQSLNVPIDSSQLVDQLKATEDARRESSEYVAKELTITISRFLEIKKREIAKKYQRLKSVVDATRNTNVSWIDDVCDRKRLDAVLSQIESANKDMLAAARVARKQKTDFEASTVDTVGEMTQNMCVSLVNELETVLTQLMNDLDSDIRFRVSKRASLRRRTLMAVAKRIFDIQQCLADRKQQAVTDAISEYRYELLKLFSRYILTIGETGKEIESNSMTVDFESLWNRRTPVSPLYRIKFIQQFVERFGIDPDLARILHDVLTQH